METPKIVRITKNGKVVAEIPAEMFPLEVTAPVVNRSGQWYEKTYSWRSSHWRDEEGTKLPDKPKGMQLQ